MTRYALPAVLALITLCLGFALGTMTTEAEVVEVEVDRYVDRIVEVPGEPIERVIEMPARCERAHADDPEHQAKLSHLAALDSELALLTAPELAHPATGLSLLQQVKLRVIFDATRRSPEDILEGRADSPDPRTAEFVRTVLGDSEVARLAPILRDEFYRYKRDHARWAIFDPLSQKLFWHICGEL